MTLLAEEHLVQQIVEGSLDLAQLTLSVCYLEADIGSAGGIGEGLLIKGGEIVRKVPEGELLETLRQELLHWGE